MIITLIILAISAFIGWTAADDFIKHNPDKNMLKAAFINISVISGIILSIFFGIFSGLSYSEYISMRSFYDSTIEQYSASIEMYQDKAIIDVESAAWSDLKYQGYQDNIHELIINLRGRIINYNENLISKRVMKKNPFFSWIIVNPDDNMKVLKMKTANRCLR